MDRLSSNQKADSYSFVQVKSREMSLGVQEEHSVSDGNTAYGFHWLCAYYVPDTNPCFMCIHSFKLRINLVNLDTTVIPVLLMSKLSHKDLT